MKTEVLQLSPILIPAINAQLDQLYTMRRYFEQSDKSAYLREHGANIRAVVTGGHTGISTEMMAALPKLEVVAVNGVGTDAIDLGYARGRGIHVAPTIGALTDDVADLAIGLLIATCRGVASGDRFVRTGAWATSPTPLAPQPLARKFSGMRIGIVGLGRVGRAVAVRASAFGCAVSYTDLAVIPGVPYSFVADLRQLARSSDALVLAAAADDAEGIVDAAVLDALGPQGFLVNIARGKLVNEADLVAALSAGRIAGAGLDVFADEPRVPAALLDVDRVVLSPHRASATLETRTAMGHMVLAALVQALAGQRPEASITT